MSETAKTPKAPSKMQRIVQFLDEHKDTAHDPNAIESAASSAPSTRTMLHHLTMAGRVWRPEPGKYQSILVLSEERLKEIVEAAQAQAKQRGAGMKRGAAELVPAPAATAEAAPEAPVPAADAPAPVEEPQQDSADVGEVAAHEQVDEVPARDAEQADDVPTQDSADASDTAAPQPEAEKPSTTMGEVLLVALKLTGTASAAELVAFLKTQPEAEGQTISTSSVTRALDKLVKKGEVKKNAKGYRLAK